MYFVYKPELVQEAERPKTTKELLMQVFEAGRQKRAKKEQNSKKLVTFEIDRKPEDDLPIKQNHDVRSSDESDFSDCGSELGSTQTMKALK